MTVETPKRDPILEIAWQHHAELDLAADRRTKGFFNIRKWIAWLGILATLFAILTQVQPFGDPLASLAIRILFVTIPVLASIFAAFATKFYSNGSWWLYRAGAEEIKKEIYTYRTILPKDKSRRDYLEKRLEDIQRKVFRNLGGEFSFEGYKGSLPSNYRPNDPNSDPGFEDLSGDEYVKYRLKHQLDWHNGRINMRKRERIEMTIAILAAGGLGALLAALGGPLALWVALTASITAALLGWQELRNVDQTIKNYSKVVVELSVLYNHWQNLEHEERTPQEFEKMVLGCERILWAQNREYIRSMQEALRESDLEKDAAFINQVIQESAESAERAKEKVYGNILDTHREAMVATEEIIDQSSKEVLGTLAAEASSELVQQELEAMGQAFQERVEDMRERASALVASLADIRQEFAHVEISKDTPPEELNTILARYPKTGEVKG